MSKFIYPFTKVLFCLKKLIDGIKNKTIIVIDEIKIFEILILKENINKIKKK